MRHVQELESTAVSSTRLRCILASLWAVDGYGPAVKDGDGLPCVLAVIPADSDVAVLARVHEMHEVLELVVQDFLEADEVEVVEEDLVDEGVAAFLPAVFAPGAALYETEGGLEDGCLERVAGVKVVADVERAEAESAAGRRGRRRRILVRERFGLGRLVAGRLEAKWLLHWTSVVDS